MAEFQELLERRILFLGHGQEESSREFVGDQGTQSLALSLIFLGARDFQDGAQTGGTAVEQLLKDFQVGLTFTRLISVDERDDFDGCVGIDAPVKLAQQFAGAAYDFGIVAFACFFKGGLGGGAGLPEILRGLFAHRETIVAQLLNPQRQFAWASASSPARRLGRRELPTTTG